MEKMCWQRSEWQRRLPENRETIIIVEILNKISKGKGENLSTFIN